MKNLLTAITMFFTLTTATYGVTITTTQDAVDFVNNEATTMINILNLSLTKLNITTCASIAVGRANDSFTIDMPANWASETVRNPAFRMIIVHEASVKTGMDRRMKIYTEGSLVDAPAVDLAHLGAIVEFTCDDSNIANRMKKGYFVQTGTSSQLVEATWDNTLATPSVQFRLVGTTAGASDDLMYVKNSVTTFGTATTMDYGNLASYLRDFSVVYRGPTCKTGSGSKTNAELVTAGCEISN